MLLQNKHSKTEIKTWRSFKPAIYCAAVFLTTCSPAAVEHEAMIASPVACRDYATNPSR